MQGKQVTLHNRKAFYRMQGEGPLVVLLHGFGEDGTVWDRQLDALKDFQLMLPDLPGSGQSELIEDMSMEGMAVWLAQLIPLAYTDAKKSGSEGFVLIGHSMGGYITLAFAEKYPGSLKGFGLFHSTAYPDSEEKGVRKKGMEFIEQHGAYEFLKTAIPNLYSPMTKQQQPWIITEQIAASHNFSNAALVQYYASMMQRPDRTQVLKTSELPLLFVLGKYDSAVPLQDGLGQCTLPGFLYIHILEESGHMGMREEIEKSNEILISYLNSIYHPTP